MPERKPDKVLISGCSAGRPCSHDARDRLKPALRRLVKEGSAAAVCPEQLGGMPTPRETAEIAGGDGNDVLDGRARVITRSGGDVTDAFLAGARRVLEEARRCDCRKAILKARSPSCGKGEIYDGSFSGSLRPGVGVTTALLQRNGIEVVTDEDEELELLI